MAKEDENKCPCEVESHSNTNTGISRRKHNCKQTAEESGEGDPDVGCSGKSCQSCTAGVIADCVAVCCCPCAVVNFFTLTFLKLPWMMGRKCLSKKKKKLKIDEKEKDTNGISRKDEGVEGKMQNLRGGLEEEAKDEYSARFEAEKVWLELYKIDQLGFGRVSFSGIQSVE